MRNRALALYATAHYAVPRGLGRREARKLLRGREAVLSPKEEAFLKKFFPKEKERVPMAWRFESLWVLLWALGWVTDLGSAADVVEVGKALEVIDRHGGLEALARLKTLRATPEILDALDPTYCQHWIVTESRMNGSPTAHGLDPGVVYERHYALNWLTQFQDQPWDDVSTDT